MNAKTSSSSSSAVSTAPGPAGKLTTPAGSGCRDVSTGNGCSLAGLGDVGPGMDVDVPTLGRDGEVARHGAGLRAAARGVGADGLQRFVDRSGLRTGAFVDVIGVLRVRLHARESQLDRERAGGLGYHRVAGDAAAGDRLHRHRDALRAG